MAVLESTAAKSRTSTHQSGHQQVTSRLDTYVLQVLPQDILAALRGVAMDELDGQITSGNLPSQILVDGRTVVSRGINQATRSVSMRFADTEMLLQAIRDAYRLMVQVTRVQVPPKNAIIARKNFWLYMNGNPVGGLPGALSKLNNAKMDNKTVLRVVGPLVNYGRKLYWNPIGRAKIMNFRQTTSPAGREIFHYDSKLAPRFNPYHMRTLRRLANSMPGGDPAGNLRRMLANRPGYVEGAAQIVKRLLRRDCRYASLHVSDGWISYPPAKSWGKRSKDDRVPSVSVQMARKGGIKITSVL